jgi:hypothetical protein
MIMNIISNLPTVDSDPADMTDDKKPWWCGDRAFEDGKSAAAYATQEGYTWMGHRKDLIVRVKEWLRNR